jgi:hypothetical protein
METESRNQRVVELLEKQIARCTSVLDGMFNAIESGTGHELQLRAVLGLAGVSAQLASAVSRVQRSQPKENLEKPRSIPQ